MQTSVTKQVNLVNTTGLVLNFWDGDAGPKNDGAVNGGNGSLAELGRQRQLDRGERPRQRALQRRAFAIFTGAPGSVTVDDGLGAVTVSGMQFAVDGYLVAAIRSRCGCAQLRSSASATAPPPARR